MKKRQRLDRVEESVESLEWLLAEARLRIGELEELHKSVYLLVKGDDGYDWEVDEDGPLDGWQQRFTPRKTAGEAVQALYDEIEQQGLVVNGTLDLSVLKDGELFDVTHRSKLTSERPAIWQRALALAQKKTQYVFSPREDPYYYDNGLNYGARGCGGDGGPAGVVGLVFVPDGGMEWLLHEVGHWVAATPEERARPHYGLGIEESGLGAEREWQAWAFEEIVLAPFGPAREFTPPTQRDGVGFSKPGPMPAWALRHVEKRIAELRLDVDEFRAVYADWISWGTAQGHRAPWLSIG